MKPEVVTVFFYGLFMDESLLASRGLSPSKAIVGYVNGYRLRIGRRATLVPDDGNRVQSYYQMARSNLQSATTSQRVRSREQTLSTRVLCSSWQAGWVCQTITSNRSESRQAESEMTAFLWVPMLAPPDTRLVTAGRHRSTGLPWLCARRTRDERVS
jgi:hypothetical protein